MQWRPKSSLIFFVVFFFLNKENPKTQIGQKNEVDRFSKCRHTPVNLHNKQTDVHSRLAGQMFSSTLVNIRAQPFNHRKNNKQLNSEIGKCFFFFLIGAAVKSK